VRWARWLILLLFGLVSLLGQGLHLFSNCHCERHHSGRNPWVSSPEDGSGESVITYTCSHGCRHVARSPAAATRSAASSTGHLASTVAQEPGHDDNCLICRYFAQGQMVSASMTLAVRQWIGPQRVQSAAQLLSLAAFEPYQARGPPTLS
jgi:hypothetical protein